MRKLIIFSPNSSFFRGFHFKAATKEQLYPQLGPVYVAHNSSGSSGSSPLQNFSGNLVYVTKTPIPTQKVAKKSTVHVISIQCKPSIEYIAQYDGVPVFHEIRVSNTKKA